MNERPTLHSRPIDHQSPGESGSSASVRRLGFRPAFLDTATMRIHSSCFAGGAPAPFHLIDGLPPEAVVERAANGRVLRAKATLISGFERGGFFYTRTATARACREWADD